MGRGDVGNVACGRPLSVARRLPGAAMRRPPRSLDSLAGARPCSCRTSPWVREPIRAAASLERVSVRPTRAGFACRPSSTVAHSHASATAVRPRQTPSRCVEVAVHDSMSRCTHCPPGPDPTRWPTRRAWRPGAVWRVSPLHVAICTFTWTCGGIRARPRERTAAAIVARGMTPCSASWPARSSCRAIGGGAPPPNPSRASVPSGAPQSLGGGDDEGPGAGVGGDEVGRLRPDGERQSACRGGGEGVPHRVECPGSRG
jgi:hypothetical protein